MVHDLTLMVRVLVVVLRVVLRVGIRVVLGVVLRLVLGVVVLEVPADSLSGLSAGRSPRPATPALTPSAGGAP
ncbi:hypothetical protein, partial [Nocardia carnea]|uniref:hypothetical protein n=1 Tax=Nocardia carnea TaxID=37328 RepID=UPI002457CAC4